MAATAALQFVFSKHLIAHADWFFPVSFDLNWLSLLFLHKTKAYHTFNVMPFIVHIFRAIRYSSLGVLAGFLLKFSVSFCFNIVIRLTQSLLSCHLDQFKFIMGEFFVVVAGIKREICFFKPFTQCLQFI